MGDVHDAGMLYARVDEAGPSKMHRSRQGFLAWWFKIFEMLETALGGPLPVHPEGSGMLASENSISILSHGTEFSFTDALDEYISLTEEGLDDESRCQDENASPQPRHPSSQATHADGKKKEGSGRKKIGAKKKVTSPPPCPVAGQCACTCAPNGLLSISPTKQLPLFFLLLGSIAQVKRPMAGKTRMSNAGTKGSEEEPRTPLTHRGQGASATPSPMPGSCDSSTSRASNPMAALLLQIECGAQPRRLPFRPSPLPFPLGFAACGSQGR